MAERNTHGVRVGRVAGAPVYLTPSAFIGALIVMGLLGPTFATMLNDTTAGYLMGLVAAGVLMVSVFAHEAAHALTAKKSGGTVHRIELTAWGGRTIHSGERRGAGISAAIAAAGPLTNLAIAGVCELAIQLLAGSQIPVGVIAVLSALEWINLGLGLFNLVPALPLDGGWVLEAVIWRATGNRARGTIVAAWAGRVLAVGIVVWFAGVPFLQGSRPDILTMVWVVLIASVLWQGASSALEGQKWRTALSNFEPRTLVRPLIVAAPTDTLAQALSRYPEHAPNGWTNGAPVIVVGDRRTGVSVVDPTAAAAVPRSALSSTPVLAVCETIGQAAYVPIGLPAVDLTGALDAACRTAPVAFVAARDNAGVVRPVGAVRAKEFAAALRAAGLAG